MESEKFRIDEKSFRIDGDEEFERDKVRENQPD